jgi:hypothetical protein
MKPAVSAAVLAIIDWPLMPLLALILGAVLVLATLIDAFEVVLLPRPVRRQTRLNHYFFKWTWFVWARCSRLRSEGRRREDFIGVYGPLSMVMLFVLWGTSLILGFGLMQWALQRFMPDAGADELISHIIVSGDAFFTLGYGDSVPLNALARLLVIVEVRPGCLASARTISPMTSSGNWPMGIATSAMMGLPPIAYTSLSR